YAVSNCMNFGSPENPDAMWQFAEAVRGLADGCAQLAVPVTGGNVSFYNQTGDEPILPTPVIAVLVIMDHVEHAISNKFSAGQHPYVLGETFDELGVLIWQQVAHQTVAGMPPMIDLDNEAKLVEFFHDTMAGAVVGAAGEEGSGFSAHFVSAARDLSEGG